MKLLKKINSLLRGPRLCRQQVNDALLIFSPKHDQVIRDYYLYVVRLVAEVLNHISLDADIVFGSYDCAPIRGRPLYRIDFQIEHTLVKQGGRGAEHALEGKVLVPAQPRRHYLVRVQDLERLSKADAVIEYSRPNLVNVRFSGFYPEFAEKLHYIAPLIYPVDAIPSQEARDLEVITLFSNPGEPRRKALLDRLQRWNPVCRNIEGRFGDIRNVYERTRILVNMRQTDYHDTLEELRVLPALLSGVIVISEDVPLREEVPYKDFILWATLNDIPDLVQEVYNNYEHYYGMLFENSNLLTCLNAMKEENLRSVLELILRIKNDRTTR